MHTTQRVAAFTNDNRKEQHIQGNNHRQTQRFILGLIIFQIVMFIVTRLLTRKEGQLLVHGSTQ